MDELAQDDERRFELRVAQDDDRGVVCRGRRGAESIRKRRREHGRRFDPRLD